MFKKFAKIVGPRYGPLIGPPINESTCSWESLKNKIVLNQNLYIEQQPNIHPFENGPVFIGENLFLVNCDKNFVFYWLNREAFPNLQNVYLASHPCEPDVFGRGFDIHLHERYARYLKWGYPWKKPIPIVPDAEFKRFLATFEAEPLNLLNK